MKRLLLLILIIIPGLFSYSQILNSSIENNQYVSYEKYMYQNDSVFHSSIRPYFIPDMRKIFDYDSVKKSYEIERFRNKRLMNLLFNRNLFALKKEEFGFTIDPLFDFNLGYDSFNDKNSWTNTRGFIAEGYLGKNFSFSTSFYENQAKTPLWIKNYYTRRKVMPGQGIVRPFGTDAVDYANASGYISWTPGKFFNFQLGHGKQFWGDGYRSLILSDFSLAHPYLMITTSFWKVRYVNLYSQYSHPDIVYYPYKGLSENARKYSSMQYLSFVPGNKWNISIFEAIIWSPSDSTGRRGIDFNYLNPVIFLKTLESDIGASSANALLGMNIRYSVLQETALYGQVVFDDKRIKDLFSGEGWAGNKVALQAGIKSFDFLGVDNLFVQCEYNFIRPYTYSHFIQLQNYSNAREPLAHPSGANIKEAVVTGKYNYKRLYFNVKYVRSGFGLDTADSDYGKDIFISYSSRGSEYGNKTGQGLYTTLNQLDFSISFLVNPSTNMNVFAGFVIRKEENSQMSNQYNVFSFGFRTSLRNLYYDFY
jgi:hypothetical protein